MLAGDWYRERLSAKQERDIALWRRHEAALESFRKSRGVVGSGIDIAARSELIRRELARVSSPSYLQEVRGSLGADPFDCQPH
jgi:hypothetical protein